MNIEDEIKQINEIINKLDLIKEDEWKQKEGEKEEEYNERIERIEENLEEELLDYISDSLLAEQEINEDEAIKEAQEKIENDYELFRNAFTKNNDGTITLKSEEELAILGYSTPEELEKLKEIEINMNNSEQYFNKIKESIKANKDINLEIDRKMELAKAIITAKRRGETIPNSLNPNLEKDKFEKANEYIANTTILKRIPIIQNEYVRNNYITERRYINLIKNVNNNVNSNRVTKIPTTRTANSTVSLTANIVTKRIPERKNAIYTNFEKKLDKDNDLTKQKIKARIKLKCIFKEIEDKELSKEEFEELNTKIENIKKKYPNTVTYKTLNKLYDIFRVKLPSKEINQQLQKDENVKLNVDSKLEPKNHKISREELIKSLKKVEKYDTKDIHNKGIDVLIINKLICYLKDNNDTEFQERLNKEISKLQTDRKNSNGLYIYDYKNIFLETLNYMYESYKNGIKSADGSRDIIPADSNMASYYLYLTYNNIQNFKERKNNLQQKLNNDIKNGYTALIEIDMKNIKDLEIIEERWNLESGFVKKVEEEFNTNREEICYQYFEALRGKYNVDELKGIERLKAEAFYTDELKKAKEFKRNTEYLDLIISKELISRTTKNDNEFKNKIHELEKKRKNGENIETETLKLLGNMYYYGIKSASDQEIVKKDKKKARDIYEQIINKNGINLDAETCSNLIDIYSDNTTPLYDKDKASRLSEIAAKNKLNIQRKSTKSVDEEPSIYVCSDLHGEYPTYKAIISQLKENDKLYILGDTIDRGPDGIKILQDMKKRKERGQIEFLIGNHEFSMIRALFFKNKKSLETWKKDGQMTKEDFDELEAKEQNEIKEFLLDSYVYKNININSKNIHLVHAKAVQEKNDNSNKTVREMMSERNEKTILEAVEGTQTAKPETFTVVGHQPTFDMIEYENGVLDIDCGASYGHNAALVNLSNGTVKYIDSMYEREKENNKSKER